MSTKNRRPRRPKPKAFENATEPTPTSSLEYARAWLQERTPWGATCPCCHRKTKVNSWRVGAGQALCLLKLVTTFAGQTVHYVTLAKASPTTNVGEANTVSKLRFWNLVEPGSKPGEWRATQLGRDFVLRGAKVPWYVETFDNMVTHVDRSQEWSFKEAMGDSFILAEQLLTTALSSADLTHNDTESQQ
jgi:hypothetical protein